MDDVRDAYRTFFPSQSKSAAGGQGTGEAKGTRQYNRRINGVGDGHRGPSFTPIWPTLSPHFYQMLHSSSL